MNDEEAAKEFRKALMGLRYAFMKEDVPCPDIIGYTDPKTAGMARYRLIYTQHYSNMASHDPPQRFEYLGELMTVAGFGVFFGSESALKWPERRT